jgi:hypothetical protein
MHDKLLLATAVGVVAPIIGGWITVAVSLGAGLSAETDKGKIIALGIAVDVALLYLGMRAVL